MFECDCPPDNCAKKVELYLAGGRCAGDQLAEKFTPLVRKIVQRVLGGQGRKEWEDASQAIFLRIFANLKQWEYRCPFCKWLAVVAARRAIDFTRAPPPMRRLPAAELADLRDKPVDPETIQQIERAVSGFPPAWRQVWQLWTQGVRREAIAKKVGKSVRTIQYWLAEMLDQVRERLEE
jgi:RNA polymerase sigma factor (sigma-70 family)